MCMTTKKDIARELISIAASNRISLGDDIYRQIVNRATRYYPGIIGDFNKKNHQTNKNRELLARVQAYYLPW